MSHSRSALTKPASYDRLYVPQVGHTTGDLNVHDVALGGDGNPLFLSARFSCLASTSDRYHFKPLWVRRFINKLAGEDRCHLNDLASGDAVGRLRLEDPVRKRYDVLALPGVRRPRLVGFKTDGCPEPLSGGIRRLECRRGFRCFGSRPGARPGDLGKFLERYLTGSRKGVICAPTCGSLAGQSIPRALFRELLTNPFLEPLRRA